MKEEIYKFYTSNLSNRKLVFRFMNARWTGFSIVSVTTLILSLIYFSTYHLKEGILTLIPFIIYSQCINHWAKNILNDKYEIKPSDYIWANESYNKLRRDLLIKYLISKSLYKEKKLKELIEICYREVEKRKRKSFVNWGLLLAVFVPIWTQFLSSIFKISANSINDAVQTFGSLVAILVFIFIVISFVMKVLNDTLNDYINKESNGFKSLANVLEDILFEIDICMSDEVNQITL